jgi:hypothetical protein
VSSATFRIQVANRDACIAASVVGQVSRWTFGQLDSSEDSTGNDDSANFFGKPAPRLAIPATATALRRPRTLIHL